MGVQNLWITYPMKQTHPDVPKEWREKLGITDTLLRLSVGLEHVDELIADLEQAFVYLRKNPRCRDCIAAEQKNVVFATCCRHRILQGRNFC